MASEEGQTCQFGTTYDFEGLDPRRTQLIACLMDFKTIEEAAKEIGVAGRTLRKWRVEPEVRAALRVCMAEAMHRGRVVLTSGVIYAATALVQMSSGEEPPDAARVAACNAVLEKAIRLTESEDMADRIAALEAKLNPKDQPEAPKDPDDAFAGTSEPTL